ncbi:unnamed protein product [Phytomonas sp. Hart1]|nr:unnamed protein product [Phytomonas sp. Hart1]|eukprot:CCW68550.1 unnamed protein product [Phytomonas sp. isolate Hart1]
MKFGKRLQDEIVPEWIDHYVSYKRLKRFIRNSKLTGCSFRKELLNVISEEFGKAENLFQELIDDLQKGFEGLMGINLDRPLPKSTTFRRFYPRRHHKGFDAAVSEDSVALVSCSSVYEAESQLGDHKDEGFLSFLKIFFLSAIGDFKVKPVEKDTPRAQFLEWYASAHQLQHFAELNLEAIRKTSKKVKKYRSMDGDHASAIEAELSRSHLTTLMPRLHKLISDVCLDYEKKFDEPLKQYSNLTLPEEWKVKWGSVFFSILFFSLIIHAPFFVETPAAHNCVALFTFVVGLWVTEAMPSFCVTMLIPLVAVPLELGGGGATPSPISTSVSRLLGTIFSPSQVLVLGGLVMGKAVSRVKLPMHAADAIHRYTAHRPELYLLAVMAMCCALCALLSNLAVPMLVLEQLQDILWEFVEGGGAPHGVLLGVAFACNLGGMLSPAASPQNALAIAALSPGGRVSFAAWVWTALPVVSLGLLVSWGVIVFIWRPFREVPYIPLQIVNTESDKEVSTAKRAAVLIVTAITVLLWLLPSNFSLGDPNLIALIPIVIFFSTGILSKKDFNTLSWNLIFLLSGGNMLSLCAHDSKMFDIIAMGLNGTLSATTPYASLIVIMLFMSIISTFVSHTVAAIVILPIIDKIGQLIQPNSGPFAVTSESLVLLCAFMCSGAMAFPISSFPNVNSLLAEDPKGNPYLRAKNFLTTGLLIQLILFISLITWMVPLTNLTLEWQRS